MKTEHIDKLFLELSQFTKAKTARELALEARLAVAEKAARECYTCLVDYNYTVSKAILGAYPWLESEAKKGQDRE
jgi:hypothetical protein